MVVATFVPYIFAVIIVYACCTQTGWYQNGGTDTDQKEILPKYIISKKKLLNKHYRQTYVYVLKNKRYKKIHRWVTNVC